MSGQILSQYHSGPAIVNYRGYSYFTQAGFTLDWLLETTPVIVDNYQQIDERVRRIPAKITFTPAGQWLGLEVLYNIANIPFGDYVTPVRPFGVIVSNVVGLANHNLLTGDAGVVNPDLGSTIPTGLIAGRLYYIRAVSSDAVTFHATRADAVAGTNILPVSGGTGVTRLTINNPCTIQNTDGTLYTFPNAAITKIPDLNLTVGATPFEEMEISFFPKDNADISDPTSLYTKSQNAYPGDGGIDPATVLTQSPNVSWAVGSPWTNFNTKEGVKIKFATTFDDIEVDGQPVLTRRYTGMVVTITAQPVGQDQGDLPLKLLVEGTGASIGRSLASNGGKLTMQSTGMFVSIPLAALRGGPEQWSVKKERIGELTWVATRHFTNGKPDPLFTVGVYGPLS
jgi:hypothetical protein